MNTWLQRIIPWLTPTPRETVGVSVLLAGALIATLWLWMEREPPPLHTPVVVAPVDTHLQMPNVTRETTVTVHVSGAVATPGLVSVPAGSRVDDAIMQLGGLAKDADVGRVNLARVLTDGEHVHIPVRGEPSRPSELSAAPSEETPLDLNHADVTALIQLPGVGQVKAEAIVEYRDTNGPFTHPGELRNVTGIGETTYQRLAPLVAVR
ncbi:MAG: ComEA family DNA-binding protein [Nitriliruptoraceae bacterium]